MALYETEEEQVEALKKWWRENGSAVIAGLVLGVAILGGWRYWTDHKHEQSATASALYDHMLKNVGEGNTQRAAEAGNRILESFTSTPYAELAALGLAKLAMDAQKYDKARAHLEWVVENSRQTGIQDIARLRLVRVMLAQGEAEAALGLLGGVESPDFASAYDAVRGDLHAALNQHEQARAAYARALEGDGLSAANRNLLQMKMDNL